MIKTHEKFKQKYTVASSFIKPPRTRCLRKKSEDKAVAHCIQRNGLSVFILQYYGNSDVIYK